MGCLVIKQVVEIFEKHCIGRWRSNRSWFVEQSLPRRSYFVVSDNNSDKNFYGQRGCGLEINI